MKSKFINNIATLLKRIGGRLFPERNIVYIMRDSLADVVTLRQFLNQLPPEDFMVIAMKYKQLMTMPKINKEKLFCINCYVLKKQEEADSLLISAFNSFYQGYYEIELADGVALEVFKKLSFTSKIFIQERNKSIKKLFSIKK